MSVLGTDVINEALLLLGVIYPGQTISAEALATAELGCNMMLGEWSAQGLAVFSVAKITKALVSGTATYTIGTGATWNTPRPEKIEAWAVTSSSGFAGSGKPVDPATFVTIARDRSAIGSIIEALNYDAAYPVGTLTLYPIPNGGTLELWVWQQFAFISDFTAAIDFPPGYLKAIVYNLAVDLAPKFGRPLDPTIATVAMQCKAGLGAVNASIHNGAPPAPAQ